MSATTPTSGASRRRKQVLGGTALATAGLLALAGPLTSALAASEGTPKVQTSETVKATLDNTGKLDRGKTYLFSQIEASGKGKVSLDDPVSTDGLRNLDGWGGPSTKDGKASYDFSVDGEKRFRTVSKFTKDLPVSVDIAYTLDGKDIEPDDLAGKSGTVGVEYTVKNVTAEPTEITYPDGHGQDVKETVDLVTPYVGQLVLDLPDSFANIASTDNRADQAGDGHGGRLVTWTMVLFEPIGQVEQKFGFTADVDDFALPSAHMQVVPVSPENHPELKFGQDGFASGAQTGRTLTDGATQIDSNLIKLRDGAAQLLDGLTQLQAGASQLSSGLAGGVPTAIDGGRQLAQGAQDAAAGGEQVADGAKQVAAGNKELADGLGALADGADQLQAGATQLSAGADQLSTGFENPDSDEDLIDGSQALAGGLGLILAGVQDLPNSIKTNAGFQQLQAALAGIAAAIGVKTDSPVNPKTLNGAINALEFGLTNPGCDTSDPTNTANPCGFKQVMALLQSQLSTPGSEPSQDTSLATLAALNAGLSTAGGKQVLEYLYGPKGLNCGQPSPLASVNPALTQQCTKVTRSVNNLALGPGNPAFFLTTAEPEVTNNALAGIIAKLGDASNASTAVGALARLQAAIDTKTATGAYAPGTLFFGLEGIRVGLTNPSCSLTDPTNPANPCGIKEISTLVSAGINTLVSGISSNISSVIAPASVGAGDLADGIAQAGDGAAQLAAGAAQLSGGLDQVAAKVPDAVSGAQALAKGSAALADGSVELAAGLSGKLAPGANQLADGLAGLQAAADGSVQLADGLTQAKAGNVQIVDGAGRLQSEGTSKLVSAGEDAAKSYGHEYAVMQALNTKGAENALPYGAPKDATDNRGAYDISIEPVGSVGGMGSTPRGVVGLVVLGLGALGATLIRGRFA